MSPQFESQSAAKRRIPLRIIIGLVLVLVLLVLIYWFYPAIRDGREQQAMIATATIDEPPEVIVSPPAAPAPSEIEPKLPIEADAPANTVSAPAITSVEGSTSSNEGFVLGAPVTLSEIPLEGLRISNESTAEIDPIAEFELNASAPLNPGQVLLQDDSGSIHATNSESLERGLQLAEAKITVLEELIKTLRVQIDQHERAIANLQKTSNVSPESLKKEVIVPVLSSIRSMGPKTSARLILGGQKVMLSVGDTYQGWKLTKTDMANQTVILNYGGIPQELSL